MQPNITWKSCGIC